MKSQSHQSSLENGMRQRLVNGTKRRTYHRFSTKAFIHGVEVDVVAEQKKSSILCNNLEEMHAKASHYDNKAEHAYSFLQVLTATTASFAHGANDVSNAVGPLATVFLIWDTGKLSSRSPIPVWVLCYGAGALVIGLWTYG
jgi:sodium-dependent phosphate transporter